MFRRVHFIVISVVWGCSGATSPNSVDAGADDAQTEPVVDVATTEPPLAPSALIMVQVDNIVGERIVDAAPPLSADFRYTFDTGVEGWELVPIAPADTLHGRSVMFSNEDFGGAASSGSLETVWAVPGADEPEYEVRVRAFSAEGAAPRNWDGYRIRAEAKKVAVPGAGCAANIRLYVLTGADRRPFISSAIWLSTVAWREVVLDLSGVGASADPSQIYEFGFYVGRDLCIPP